MVLAIYFKPLQHRVRCLRVYVTGPAILCAGHSGTVFLLGWIAVKLAGSQMMMLCPQQFDSFVLSSN